MKSRKSLKSFYYHKSLNRNKRTLELQTNRTKDLIASRERQFLLNDSKGSKLSMPMGDKGMGVGSFIKGYDQRGGTCLKMNREHYATTVLTIEYMTSQTCIYCFSCTSHPILGTSQRINTNGTSFWRGRACNNRDVMSAAAIGLSTIIKLIFNKDLRPFCPKPSLQ